MNDDETYHKRIESIYQMLFEMAGGNFNFKIEGGGTDGELNKLIALVNLVAEELRATVFRNGYINSHIAFQYLVQNTFVLNQKFIVKSFSPDINNLGYNASELFNAPFSKFLFDKSARDWTILKPAILADANYHTIAQLTLVSKMGTLIPAFCTITRLLHSSKIVISAVTIVLHSHIRNSSVLLNSKITRKGIKTYDEKIIYELYDYIMQNLDSPLPSARMLSKNFETNQQKLKDGFRHFFNTSIYQFYNEERLKRAHLLIQQTTLPLGVIANMVGFSVYPNFFKAFKKRFLYAPSLVPRNNRNENNDERYTKR